MRNNEVGRGGEAAGWNMADAPRFGGEWSFDGGESGVEYGQMVGERGRAVGEGKANSSEIAAEHVGEKSAEKAREVEDAREQVREAYSGSRVAPSLASLDSAPQPRAIYGGEPKSGAKRVLEVMKKTAVMAGNTLVAGAAIVATPFFPPAVVVLFPTAVFAADTVRYAAQGVNGSMFIVDRKNQIKQRLNPFPVLMRHRGQSSSEIYKEETERLFDGLKPGQTYKTQSHAVTYSLLRGAEKQGMIYDLSAKKTGKPRNFFFEFLVTGNWSAIRKRKKYSYYNISFKVRGRAERI